jgi:N-acylneuraminate cytidylyltransferase
MICVIPARGGSKRIPLKNIADFHGRPMIGWAIEAALGAFSRVVVSTDDPRIAAVARNEGAEVLDRPADLAGDHTPTVPVIAHAVTALALAAETPVCCLYATAPMVLAADLAAAAGRLALGDATYVMAVTPYPHPIQRALRRDPAGHVAMIDPAQMQVRSQDLEEAWHDAGQFYFARAATWAAGLPVFGPGAVGMALPAHRVVDIDTPDDWARAEALFALARPKG